jgi:galactose mutarotase-like enzyme
VGDTIRLAAGSTAATIAVQGAEPLAWSVGGRDLLWQADAAWWDRTSPILFPIVGRACNGEIRVGGESYPIGVHGFAASKPFEICENSENSAKLTLKDDHDSRKSFPFSFELEVVYEVSEGGLSAAFTVRNPGAQPLPYALGVHPGFRWPFSGVGRDGYRVEFEKTERPEVPVITKGGLFSTNKRPVPLDGRILPLSDELLSREALCFLNANSRFLRFVAPDGAAISMIVEDFPHFAIWSKAGAPFVSLEAWTGHGDPDGFEGDISEKPSMRLLAPGAEARHGVRFGYDKAA